MRKQRTLLTYHDLTVEVESTPGKELLDHMYSTILGQPGGIRYQHTNLEDRLNAPGENYYMFLRKGGNMLGSVGFCNRPYETHGLKHDSWLIRYFSIKAPMRMVPNKRKEKADLKDENKRAGILGRFIQPIFTDPSQLREEKPEKEAPSIIYAIIEQKNLRSMNFSEQMGMKTIGQTASFTFSRLNPRKSKRVEQLPLNEQPAMLGLLNQYYHQYTLFYPDPLFKDHGYFVIRRSGKVVAGIQVYPVTWRLVDLGSGLANSLLKILANTPGMKKRFHSDVIHFLAFDGIYAEEGHESDLYELMEGVLERYNTYLGMIMVDKKSGLYHLYQKTGHLGFLNKLFGSFTADIRMRFINVPETIQQYFMDHPVYIPTYDNS